MNTLLFRVYIVGLLIILFGVTIHAPVSVWLGTLLPDYLLAIKAWKEVLLTLLIGVGIVLVIQKKIWGELWRQPIFRLSLGYIVLHGCFVFFSDATVLARLAGILIDLRFIVYFLLCYVALRIDRTILHLFIKTFLAAATVVIGFGVLQITVLPDNILANIGYSRDTIASYNTIDSNPDFVRINSTLRGPNPLGAFVVIVCGIMVAYAVKKWHLLRYRHKVMLLITIGLSVAVLFASYSRSAYVGIVIAAIATLLFRAKLTWKWRYSIAGLITVIMLLIGGLLFQSTDTYRNVVLHEDPESTVQEKSNSGHLSSLLYGTERALKQPFGNGVGSTGSASLYGRNGQIVENYYLFVAHEVGWIGLALFIALVGTVLRQLYLQRQRWFALGLLTSGIGLAFIALVLPVWADETVALLWWGLAGSIIGYDDEARTRQ